MRGATSFRLDVCPVVHVSIHAPRVGRDEERSVRVSKRVSFNPRAPCGARRPHITRGGDDNAFQSTRPVWGATLRLPCWYLLLSVSIHAPRVGRDTSSTSRTRCRRGFNPRAPCGARLSRKISTEQELWVSIHAPRVGRDIGAVVIRCLNHCFNPRAPCGARPRRCREAT